MNSIIINKTINAEIDRLIKQRGGKMSLRDLVAEARHRESPLHHLFDSDKSEPALRRRGKRVFIKDGEWEWANSPAYQCFTWDAAAQEDRPCPGDCSDCPRFEQARRLRQVNGKA